MYALLSKLSSSKCMVSKVRTTKYQSELGNRLGFNRQVSAKAK
jgi:hypothetical protein